MLRIIPTLLLLSNLLQPLEHLTAGPCLMPQLFLLDLISQMHLLFHRQQNRTTVDQIVDRRMEANSLTVRELIEPEGIRLRHQREQSLTDSRAKLIPQNLKVESLFAIDGNRTKPAQPSQACQLLVRVIGGRRVRDGHLDQEEACMEATSAAKSDSSTSIPSPRV